MCVGSTVGWPVGFEVTVGAGDGSPRVGSFVATIEGLWLGEIVGDPAATAPAMVARTTTINAEIFGTPRPRQRGRYASMAVPAALALTPSYFGTHLKQTR